MRRAHKIFIIGPCLHMGGIERASATVANYLASMGDHVVYLSIFRHPRFFDLDESIVFEEPEEGRNVDRLSILPTLLRIRKRVRHHAPDTIIAFNKFYAALSQIALFGIKVPLYVSERSSPLYKWRKMPGLVSRLATLINPPTGVIAQTEIAAEYQRKYYPPKSEIRVIPNPVRRMEQYNVKRENIILAVGRLSDQLKGFDLLLEAYSKLENPAWKLVFAGSTQGAEALLCMAGKSPNSQNIEFLGNVKEIDELFVKAGMFVIPSRSEGFPNALIEAMASGTASISFDFVAGPKDLIEDGVNGILVEPENTDKLAEAIQCLIDDSGLRLKLGEKARETGELLDEDIIGNKFREFILEKV